MTTATVIAFILQGAAFLAVLVFVLRHNAARQDAHDAAIAALAAQSQNTARRLIESVESEREARRDEIQTLLQRIQAPEQAVIQHAADTATEPPQSAYPHTEQEQAEAQDAALLAERTLQMIHAAEADLAEVA